MWVFIKGLPKDMDSRGLERLVRRQLLKGWFPLRLTGRIRITGAKILKIVHTRTRSVEYHGLIKVFPASKAGEVIERLNQTKVAGRKLGAHLYCKRFARADRRKVLFTESGPHSPERRHIDRRRKHLVSQVVDASL